MGGSPLNLFDVADTSLSQVCSGHLFPRIWSRASTSFGSSAAGVGNWARAGILQETSGIHSSSVRAFDIAFFRTVLVSMGPLWRRINRQYAIIPQFEASSIWVPVRPPALQRTMRTGTGS